MKNLRLILLSAVAVALVAVPAAQATTLTIKVTSISVAFKPTDRAPKGASKGDTVLYKDNLVNVGAQFNRPKGAKVGSDHGTLTFTSPHSATFDGIAVLPNGTLVLRGSVVSTANGGFTIPITGGTGSYDRVHGYLLVGPGSKRALNTYHLVLPAGNIA